MLSDTFQVKRNTYVLLKELIESKPVPKQSLYEFYFQQKAKIDRLHLGFRERDVISIIVGSKGDVNIISAAEAGSFKYCDELASFLHGKTYTELEKSVPSKNSTTTKHPFRSNNTISSQTVTENKVSSSATEISTPSSNRNATNGVTCYRCGEPGHRRINCTIKDNVKCGSCNKLGHLEKACKSKTSMKVEKDAEVKMINDSKEKKFKKNSLDELKCEGFFDMGAACSLITEDFVRRNNLHTFLLNAPVNLFGFRNDLSAQVTRAVAVNLKVDSVAMITTFYVIDELSGGDILIGRNFTEDIIFQNTLNVYPMT
ncbi:uncharacterized protein LOC134753907 [Cydia strobilella]|uniref:uncharacterized protein LOC134753907 n=1 Tax=Cydia strobilella TaxID=1100964 RepID=UPI003006A674